MGFPIYSNERIIKQALSISIEWQPIGGSTERRHCSRTARSVFPMEWPSITVRLMNAIARSVVSGVTIGGHSMVVVPTTHTHTHTHTHTQTQIHRRLDRHTVIQRVRKLISTYSTNESENKRLHLASNTTASKQYLMYTWVMSTWTDCSELQNQDCDEMTNHYRKQQKPAFRTSLMSKHNHTRCCCLLKPFLSYCTLHRTQHGTFGYQCRRLNEAKSDCMCQYGSHDDGVCLPAATPRVSVR